MTGRPAALRALAFASTASVADSAIPPTRLEMRGRPDAGVEVAGGVAASVMAPSFHRRPDPDTRVPRASGSGRRRPPYGGRAWRPPADLARFDFGFGVPVHFPVGGSLPW